MEPKLTPPPCSQCTAACCRQDAFSHRKVSVILNQDEYAQFPEAIPCGYASSRTQPDELGLPYVDGKCIHLGDDNRCKIYDRRPDGCVDFSCVDGYCSRPRGEHSWFLADRPALVQLIETAYPEWSRAWRELRRPKAEETPCPSPNATACR